MAPSARPQDLFPNSFSGVGGGTMSNTVNTLYDFYNPSEWPVLLERHQIVPGFGAIVRALGFTKGCANPSTGHYEAPWSENLVRVDSIVTPASGAGNAIIVALTADSMFDTEVTVGGAARKASFPRVGDIIKTPSGAKAQITAKNVTTDPHRLTLTPTDSTVDLDDEINAGESYFISDNAWGEGTGLPEGVQPRIIKYTNDFQIVKESVSSSGTELSNATYFEPVPGQPGSFFLRAKADTYRRFEKRKDGALVWGELIDNITVASQVGHDVPVKGTEGMVSFAEINSRTQTYTVGGFALNDFDTTADIFEDERIGTRDVMTLDGRSLFSEKENVLLAMLNGDAMGLFMQNYMPLSGLRASVLNEWQPATETDHAAMIGFKAVKKNGYTFVWKILHEFNDIMGAGAEGYNWRNSSIMMPVGYASDKMTGERRSLFGYEYKSLGGFSRENVIDEIAGVGAGGSGTGRRAVNEYDILKLGFVAEVAGHYACSNQVVLLRPA